MTLQRTAAGRADRHLWVDRRRSALPSLAQRGRCGGAGGSSGAGLARILRAKRRNAARRIAGGGIACRRTWHRRRRIGLSGISAAACAEERLFLHRHIACYRRLFILIYLCLFLFTVLPNIMDNLGLWLDFV